MWIDQNGFPRTKRYEIRLSQRSAESLCLRIFKDGKPISCGILAELGTNGVTLFHNIDRRAAKKLGIRLTENGKFAGFDTEKILKALEKQKKRKSGPKAASKRLENGYRLETGADDGGDPALVLAGNGVYIPLASISSLGRLLVYEIPEGERIHAHRAGLPLRDGAVWDIARLSYFDSAETENGWLRKKTRL